MSISLNTDGPTSTTKALLVSVVTPRLFSTKKKTEVTAPSEIVVETETVATSTASSSQQDEPRVYDAPAADDVGDSSEVPEVPMVVQDGNHTAEFFAKTELHASSVPTTNEEEKEPTGRIEEETQEEETKEESKEEQDDKPTPEEEAAVVKVGKDPDDNQVNVEELLRITFQSLLEEWHLLSFPSFTIIHRRIEDTKDTNGFRSIFEHLNEKDAKPTWIQVQVMARPASLGAILDRLERIGVGTDIGTVSVFRAELCRTASPYATMPVVNEDEKEDSEDSITPSPHDSNHAQSVARAESTGSNKDSEKEALSKKEQERIKNERMIQEARQEWKNAATKLRIEQVREQIVEMSAFSFDFIALLAVASILAGVGLITDNTVVIVASMLVSPIMGPVLGCTFGTRILDWILVKSSLWNEVLALFGCVIIGVLVGIPSSFTSMAENDWPTNEMEIRGETSGLLTGIAIAIPSGMGVCLSILGGNTSSLVGVAISASLLPPAVNTGICFIYSFFLAVGAVSNGNGKSAHDFAVIGGISLALTIINIVCIWLSGIVMFEIKEVAPTVEKSAFWSKDLKAARKWNKQPEGGEGKLPPVNVEVLQQGTKAAIHQSQDEISIDTVKFQPPPPQKHVRMQSLEHTLSMHETKANRAGLLGPLWATSMNIGESPQEDDNVRYVGVEDMGTLLGFHEEDAADVQEEHEAENLNDRYYFRDRGY